MQLSTIITRVIQLLGLESEVSVDTPSPKLTKLVDCANAVYSELTLEYVHLKTRAELEFSAGRVYYTAFPEAVREVLAVRVNGTKIPFKMYPLYLFCEGFEGTAEVEFIYHLGTLALADEAVLPPQFTVHTLATGVAAEYYYRTGLIDEAMFYKARFENSVSNLSRSLKSFKTPTRRFIC